MRGIQHTIEPEADSLSFIDFEDDDEVGGIWNLNDRDRFLWTRKMVDAVVWTVLNEGGQGPSKDLIATVADALVLSHTGPEGPFDLNEGPLWEAVARFANAKGFDTYNSDSRFEVFPGNTPVYQDA